MRDPDVLGEELLARLFTDAEFRARFRRDPAGTGREFGLDAASIDAFARADWIGLDLAARSYQRKRERHG
ncbi:MAG TPA: hypothetical protein VMF52_15720 [Steroidobacteraceae bacterium]|nr:hypothetical protein [Steroidobacteraceae bacterium]